MNPKLCAATFAMMALAATPLIAAHGVLHDPGFPAADPAASTDPHRGTPRNLIPCSTRVCPETPVASGSPAADGVATGPGAGLGASGGASAIDRGSPDPATIRTPAPTASSASTTGRGAPDAAIRGPLPAAPPGFCTLRNDVAACATGIPPGPGPGALRGPRLAANRGGAALRPSDPTTARVGLRLGRAGGRPPLSPASEPCRDRRMAMEARGLRTSRVPLSDAGHGTRTMPATAGA